MENKFKNQIKYGLVVVCISAVLLSFHVILSGETYTVTPKENFTFSNTFIFQGDIDNLLERYNSESFMGRATIASEPLFKKLIEKGIIYTGKIEPELCGTTSQPIEPIVHYFKMGDEIKFGGSHVITVTKYEDNVQLEYMDAGKDRKYVAVELIYTNISKESQSLTGISDITLYDEEGYSYRTAYMSKQPELSFLTSVSSGRKTKGWVTFDIAKGVKSLSLQLPQGVSVQIKK